MKQDRSLLTRLTGFMLCCLGLLVLIGWIVGNQAMVRIVPGSVAMSISTALMFFVAGAGLLLCAFERAATLAFRACCWFLIVLSSLILSEHLFDIDLPIDLVAVHDRLGDGHAKPGRTSPNACLGFLLGGLAMLLSLRGPSSRGAAWSAIILATITFGIGLTAFLGYVLRLDAMYQFAAYNRMAIFTALGMTTLGIGIWTLASLPHELKQHLLEEEAPRITKLATAMMIVFALATSVMSFAVLRDSFEKSAADHHMSTAKSTAFSVAAFLDQIALLSASVASRPVLAAPLQRLRENPGDLPALDALQAAGHIFRAMGFSAARIIAPSGQTLFAMGAMAPMNGAISAPFGKQNDASRLLWNGGFYVRSEHRLLEQGDLVATVVTEQRIAPLDAFLDDARRASASTDILLCTRSGKHALCFPSRFYESGAKLEMFKPDGSPALPVSHALLGRTGSQNLKDPRGALALAGYAPVPHHQLGVVVRTSARELYTPLRDKLHVLVFAVLAFVALGVWLLRRWLQPLVVQIVEERQRIKAILENSNDAFIGIGPDGAVTDWNKQAEKTLGISALDAIGHDLAKLIIPPRFRHAHNQGLLKFHATGEGPAINNRVEVSALHADGHEIPVELSVTAMHMDGQFGASAFLRDLSERKAAEASAAQHATALEEARTALAQSQKLEAVGKLTGGIAHDFNNVLQVIKGSLELLRIENKNAIQVLRRIDTAAGAVRRGASLASQLLAFARKQPLQPKPTDLGRVVRSLADMLQRALGDAVNVSIIVGPGTWNTMVDPNQLEHVILNLAINARDAMNGAGRLSIEVSNATLDDDYARFEPGLSTGQFVLLAISDNGSGMSPETMQKAFEPFYSTKPEGQGTGLGLSMAYGFVKQSEGHIKIYSELGHGTTIRIYLPRTAQHELLAAAPQSAAAVEGGPETILVVEDDLAVQATVVDLLTGFGYRVLKADHARMALDLIESGAAVDLLFTDVVMPGELRSPELARRAVAILPGLKVLFTSGYTQDAINHGGRLDPSVHLLSKPYGREKLGLKLRSVLSEAPSVAEPVPVERRLRVAFVEDHDDFRALGAEMVKGLGYAVETFATAELALARIIEGSIHGEVDVLLTDLGLPGMSGVELGASVHAHANHISIILASGYGDAFSDSPAFPFQVLPKPFTIEQLDAALHAAIRA